MRSIHCFSSSFSLYHPRHFHLQTLQWCLRWQQFDSVILTKTKIIIPKTRKIDETVWKINFHWKYNSLNISWSVQWLDNFKWLTRQSWNGPLAWDNSKCIFGDNFSCRCWSFIHRFNIISSTSSGSLLLHRGKLRTFIDFNRWLPRKVFDIRFACIRLIKRIMIILITV